MRIVVLFKEGFEELEALSVVDVLRRANITCDMIGMDALQVTSSHRITVQMDSLFQDDVYQADGVVIPGGLPGATSLRDDERVIHLLQTFHQQDKLIAAICAGPIVLEKAGVIQGKRYTCYPGFEKEIMNGIHQDTLTCVDGQLITGRGPAAALEFSYCILEKLGKGSYDISHAMQYHYLSSQKD